tara:strand:+ start:210 stop:941 length:732 start_codon:yes stop_codon:yes gene_type:complete
MREYFRPYNKVVTLTDDSPTTVTFTDSGGARLMCNYISVLAVSGDSAETGYFQVIPSGVNTLYGATGGGSLSGRSLGPSSYPDASARSDNSASGVLGILADAAVGGPAIISLGPVDSAAAIILSKTSSASTTFQVTYGQVNLSNPRADNTSMGNAQEATYVSATAGFTSFTDAATSTVTFANNSLGVPPFTWAWNFDVTGAGPNSSVKDPSYTYVSGTSPFTAQLSISALHGTSTVSSLIVIS